MQIWPIEIDGFELSGGNHDWYLVAESDFQTDSDEMREHNRSGDYCADTRQTNQFPLSIWTSQLSCAVL